MANPSSTGLIHFGTNAGNGNIRQGNANDYKIILNNVNSIDWFTDAITSENGSWKPKKFTKYWNDQFGSKKLISQANFEENGNQHSIAFQLSKPKAKQTKLIFNGSIVRTSDSENMINAKQGKLSNLKLFISGDQSEIVKPDCDSNIIGSWFHNVNDTPSNIVPGTNTLIAFKPYFDPTKEYTLPQAVNNYKKQNPNTKVFASYGSGQIGLTTELANDLARHDWSQETDIDGFSLEMEILGTGQGTSGYQSINQVISDLNALKINLKNYNKEFMITTGGSGFTAELGCSLPGATSTCNPADTLTPGGSDSENLKTFIQELSKIEFDYWSPQIYAKDMGVKWYGWEKTYFDLWSSVPPKKIIPSVPQIVNVDTIDSMKTTLSGWLSKSDLFPELSETLPFVGYPYLE